MGTCSFARDKIDPKNIDFCEDDKEKSNSIKNNEHNKIESKINEDNKESYLQKEEYSNSLPKKSLSIILKQMNRICKILCTDGSIGTGFFCCIPFPNKKNLLPVLITNNHILNENYITSNNKINFTVNDDKLKYEIKIEESRKKYTSKVYDITIIEIIKEKDGIDRSSFLEIDDLVFQNNSNDVFKNKSIYILHYKNGDISEYSSSIIQLIENDNFTIRHKCQTEYGSSGAPILDLKSNCVIGIHKGCAKIGNWNVGSLIKNAIEEFNKKYQKEIDFKQINGPNKENDQITIIYNFFHRNINEENIKLYSKLFKEEISDYKLFGEKFVERNKNICKIVIGEKEYKLSSYLKNEFNERYKVLKIELKGISKITDMSYIFCGCNSLYKLENFDKINTTNITNLECIFTGCKYLEEIQDISNWNIENVTNISYMFFDCYKLKNLCDISNWNTKNVIDMNNIFDNCKSLETLPNLGKWNTSNVRNMSYAFHVCSSLIQLPDISQWKTEKVENFECIFAGTKISSLPDISNWKTHNSVNMKGMFCMCSSILSLPDISKWDTSHVKDMSFMFSNCSSLRTLPDISKWKTNNVIGMGHMFEKCSLLSSLPDISNWNTYNVINMEFMFSFCSSLESLPPLYKWNFKKVENLIRIFTFCSSLKSLNISKWNIDKRQKILMFIGCNPELIFVEN